MIKRLPTTLQLKHAVKVGVAAGLLATVCWHADLKMVHYPAMGLVATMVSLNTGETLQNGWGRLAGSLLGGTIAALWISLLGLSPFTGTLAFATVLILGESLQLPTVQSQAAAVVGIILGSKEFSRLPWDYALNRALDNCLGIVIGVLITLCLWPEQPGLLLQQYSCAILAKLQTIYEDFYQRWHTGQPLPSEIDRALYELINDLRQAEVALEKSVYGVAGWMLVLQDWSDRLISLRRLRRHLLKLTPLAQPLHDNPLAQKLYPAFDALWQGLKDKFAWASTRQPRQSESTPTPVIPLMSVHQQLSRWQQQGLIQRYSLEQVLQVYWAVYLGRRLSEDLSELAQQTPPAPPQRSKLLNLRFHPIGEDRLRRFLKASLAFAIGMAVITYFPFSAGFYVTLAIAVCFQANLGNSLEAARQRALGTLLGLVVAEAMIHSLGSNALSIGLGTMLIVLLGELLNIPQGYKPGAFLLIVALMAYRQNPEAYIADRFWETLVGIFIALAVDMAFWRETAATRLDREMAANFQRLATLYAGLLADYRGERSPSDREALLARIRKSYYQQLDLCRLTNLESAVGFGVPEKRRLWNIGLNYQLSLLSNFQSLDFPRVPHRLVPEILAGFAPDLTELLHTLSESLRHGFPTARDLKTLETQLQKLESHLDTVRQHDQLNHYPLEAVLEALGVIELIREVTGDLVPAIGSATAEAEGLRFLRRN